MRHFFLAAALLCATPALAQQPPAAPAPAPDEDTVRASHALSAIWRPYSETPGDTAADLAASCDGAQAELEQVDAAIPETTSAETLSAVRAPHGLVIVPTPDEPRALFVFPNAALSQITPGLAVLHVLNADQALVGLTDAGGRQILLQLGSSHGKAMMRILQGEAEPLLYVGCAPSSG